MRKRITVFLIVLALFSGFTGYSGAELTKDYVPPKTPPLSKDAAMADDNRYLEMKKFGKDYFVSYNPALKLAINMEQYPEFNNTHLLFYGGPHGDKGDNGEYRYTGVNDVGENLPNIRFPNDVEPVHQYLEQNNWLPAPWQREDIAKWMKNRGETMVWNEKLDGKPELRRNIWWGLKLMHSTEFRGDENVEWERYVHVLQPPTFWGWGWGRAWHKENGTILYRSIPIAPESVFVKWVPNLYVKDFDPGTPAEQDPETGKRVFVAEPFTTYTATVTFGINADNAWITRPPADIPIFIGAAHQVKESYYKANLAYKSGPGAIGGLISAYPWGAPAGYKYQTVKFNANKAEIVATFRWTAQPESKSLMAGINAWPGYGYLYEGETGLEYADNVASATIKVKPIPDAYVQSLNPGTNNPEKGKEYHGTVTYGLAENFPEPAEVKLGLTHNGWPVSGVDGKTITLNPGETMTLPFVWYGQDGKSTLIAKIWPQKPILNKDLNWANNTKRVELYQSTDLTVTNLNPGTTPFFVNNTYNGSVVVKNNLAVTVNNVVVKFYKGKAEIPGTRRVIASLGPNASTTVHFSWKAPAAKGRITIAAAVNPDRTIPETNYNNNYVSEPVYINDSMERQEGGQLHISASVSPAKTRAGWGFSLTVNTWTDDYVWYEDGVRKSRPCPGPQRVIAYFADGNSVELERSTPGRPASNTWQLPPNPRSPQKLRKKYIPKDTPDGEFITKIVAEGAGDNGEFTAKTSVVVIVEGGIYDDVGSRITQ
ncbi:CARDB protein (plasmid) [Carboxydocella thermautotrophica]|nr:CARDB protein [Carboxydocella thermautotrophica]